MLNYVRRRAGSWIVKVLFGGLAVIFAFWGIGSGFFNQVTPVAVVDGQRILAPEVDQESETLRQTLENVYGQNAAQALQKVNLRAEAVNELIENHLIGEQARRLGIEISNKQLQEKIAALPQLQRDGQFDYDTYEQILRGNGMTPAQFESRMRSDLARQMVQQMVEQGVAVSEDEARAAYNLRNQTIALRYIEIPYSSYLAKNSPTEQQVADYYKQHQDDFREPERAQVELIHYTPQSLAASVNPSDQEIKDYYQSNLVTEFTHQEKVHARHILITVPAGATAQEKNAAKAKAEDILKQAQKKGADFAKLAQQYSQDPSTRVKGGDLGFFGRGEMIKAFEDTAFGLKPGQIAMVETSFGFHVIKVEETRPAHTDTQAEARAKIIDDLRNRAGGRLARQALDQDLDQALRGTKLADIAKNRGLELLEPPPFAQGEAIAGIGSDPKVTEAVFAVGENTVRALSEGDSPWLIKIVSRIPAHVPPLKEIEAKVRDAYAREHAAEDARADAQKLIEQIKSPADFNKVIDANKLTAHTTGTFTRASTTVPEIGEFPEVADAASMVPQVPGVIGRVMEHQGDSFIFEVTSRGVPTEKEWQAASKSFTDEYVAAKRAEAWTHFLDDLKAHAKVVINNDQIGQPSRM